MSKPFLIFFVAVFFTTITFSTLYSQKRSKNLVKALETTNPEEYKAILEKLKVSPNNTLTKATSTTTKAISTSVIKEVSNDKTIDNAALVSDKKLDPSSDSSFKFSIPQATPNTAISNGIEAKNEEPVVAARELKYKADESDVEKYKKLRVQFDAEAKKKELQDKLEAKKEALRKEKEYNERHISPGQSAQFDKIRYGKKEEEEEKKTPKEEYNELFK